MPSLWELSQQEQSTGTGNPVLDRATEINESTGRVYDRIRGNAELSADGKRRQIAKAYLETQRRLAEHKSVTDQARAAEGQRLTRSAFGSPSDPVEAMSYRQARQIAEGIEDPNVAQAKLTAAMTEGDSLLAKAIARHAVDQRDRLPGLADPKWASVLDTYTQANPAVGNVLNQLHEVTAPKSAQAQFMEVGYFMTPKPSELDRLQDHQIEQIASDQTSA